MAQQLNLVIDQGADYYRLFELVSQENPELPWNIQGASASLFFRKTEFEAPVTEVVLMVVENTIAINIPADVTSTYIPDNYYYTIEFVFQGNKYRLTEGNFKVTPSMSLNNSNEAFYAR